MKLKSLLLSVFMISLAGLVSGQQLTIGSFNLRFDNPRDTGNLWADRAPVVAALIRFHDFDILGTQEGLKNQLDDISTALPEFTRYGLGRDDGKDKGEHSAIYFKNEKFTLLQKGDFWLSQTPDKPSMGWDGKCCHRICSWVHLQDNKTKKKFFVFNAHFDHQGIEARKESSKLVLQKIKEIAGSAPVVFTGDLNGDHNSTWYQTLAASNFLKDTYKEVKYPYANNASFNAFGGARNRTEIIDHIFTTRQFAVSKWGVLTDTYNGKFPSDHFPVLAEVVLN